ncbi:FbpB family small basic protein [Niallia oryzisoli]|uniref:FbpB family small basic protein n=1 Tax=Niallia oryzisoli TaxID=1737571 RepID=A0ABZ2CBK9_9BACI
MNKPKKRPFAELVKENKLQLLRDQEAMEKIEQRLEKKHIRKAK